MRSNVAPTARGAQSPTREGPGGPTGPGGWVGGWADVRERVSGDGQVPTHSSPLQGLTGPAPLGTDLAGADPGIAGTRYYPPVIPRYTHPLYPVPGTHRARTSMGHAPPPWCTGPLGHAHMVVSGTAKENLGVVEHTHVSGSQAGYIQFNEVSQVCTAV